MHRNIIETVMGAVVLLAALGFLFVIYDDGGIKGRSDGYPIVARFDRADGLIPGTDVRLGGIKVGSITDQKLDTKTYQAIVTLSIDSSIPLPKDTSAKITSDGLLGSNYLSLTPGAEDDNLKPGEEITHTQGAVNVLELIAKYAFGSASPEAKP